MLSIAFAKSIILNDFNFDLDYIERDSFIEKQIQKNETISVHLRFGDYKIKNNSKIYFDLSKNYFEKSINYFLDKIENPKFIIFSDELNKAKSFLQNINNFKELNIIFRIPGNNSGLDMKLMSVCNHNIISNSTFSWWGAWLNTNKNKIIICPNNWYSLEYVKKYPDSEKKLYPDDWIRF